MRYRKRTFIFLYFVFNIICFLYANDDYLQLEKEQSKMVYENKPIYLLNTNKTLTEKEKQQLKNNDVVDNSNINDYDERKKIMNDIENKNKEYIEQYELEQQKLVELERHKEKNLIKDREELDKQAKLLEQQQKQIEQKQQQLAFEQQKLEKDTVSLRVAKLANDETTKQLQQQQQALAIKEANIEQQRIKIEQDKKDIRDQVQANNQALQQQLAQNKADTEKALSQIQAQQQKNLQQSEANNQKLQQQMQNNNQALQQQLAQNKADTEKALSQIQAQQQKNLQQSEANNQKLQQQMQNNNQALQQQLAQNKADTEKVLSRVQVQQQKNLQQSEANNQKLQQQMQNNNQALQQQLAQNKADTEKALSRVQVQQGKNLEQTEEIKTELKKIQVLNRSGVIKSTNNFREYSSSYIVDSQQPNIDILNKINNNLTYSVNKKQNSNNISIMKGGWSNKDLIEENRVGFIIKKQSKKIDGMEIESGPNKLKIKQLREFAYKASETKDYEIALKYYKQLVMLDKKDNFLKLSLATTYHLLGQYRQAKSLYIELLDVYPNNEQLASNLISIIIQETPYEAVYLVPAFADKYYDSSLIQAQASVAFSKVGKYDKAIEYLQKAISLNQENIDYKYNLAVLYDMSKNYDNAIKLYKDVMNQDPTNYSRNNKIKRRLAKLS